MLQAGAITDTEGESEISSENSEDEDQSLLVTDNQAIMESMIAVGEDDDDEEIGNRKLDTAMTYLLSHYQEAKEKDGKKIFIVRYEQALQAMTGIFYATGDLDGNKYSWFQ